MDPPDAFLEIPERPRKCGSTQADFAGVKAGWPCCVWLHSRFVRHYFICCDGGVGGRRNQHFATPQYPVHSLDTCECVLLRSRRWHGEENAVSTLCSCSLRNVSELFSRRAAVFWSVWLAAGTQRRAGRGCPAGEPESSFDSQTKCTLHNVYKIAIIIST